MRPFTTDRGANNVIRNNKKGRRKAKLHKLVTKRNYRRICKKELGDYAIAY